MLDVVDDEWMCETLADDGAHRENGARARRPALGCAARRGARGGTALTRRFRSRAPRRITQTSRSLLTPTLVRSTRTTRAGSGCHRKSRTTSGSSLASTNCRTHEPSRRAPRRHRKRPLYNIFGLCVLPDQIALASIAELGLATAASHAVTLSFETSLARLVARSWNDATRAGLSVDFLVAFACELAPRLDVHHRIRSAVLAEADVRKLSAPPFAPFVDQATLRAFQDEPRAK